MYRAQLVIEVDDRGVGRSGRESSTTHVHRAELVSRFPLGTSLDNPLAGPMMNWLSFIKTTLRVQTRFSSGACEERVTMQAAASLNRQSCGQCCLSNLARRSSRRSASCKYKHMSLLTRAMPKTIRDPTVTPVACRCGKRLSSLLHISPV